MQKSGFIAIIGRPNAGKSTLLNTILKTEISIVTPKAQTTRDQVLGIYTQQHPKDGHIEGQIIFVDTPGIHRAREGGINQYMVEQAAAALEAPHAIWYLVDPSSRLEFELPVIELIAKGYPAKNDSPGGSQPPIFILLNKMDFAKSKKIPISQIEDLAKSLLDAFQARGITVTSNETFQISALKGQGIDLLMKKSWELLPEGPLYYPDPEQLSDRPTRFFVAEKIREQLLHCLGDELPYSCAVEITLFKEDPKLPRIEATIHVERESQKGMVIGNKGKKIKEIGQKAREAIEKFLGQKIFLGLKVDLLKNWSSNAEALEKMGYNLK